MLSFEPTTGRHFCSFTRIHLLLHQPRICTSTKAERDLTQQWSWQNINHSFDWLKAKRGADVGVVQKQLNVSTSVPCQSFG